jgi:tetratricopeptide (TPR) repeat protein
MSPLRSRAPRALLLGLLLAGNPLPALAATDVDRYVAAARRLYDNLEYERALDQIQRARRVSRGVEQDVTLGLYEGILLADLGRWKDAREAFFTALLLRPDASLPLRVSPKVEREFEAQRTRARDELARLQESPTVTPSPVKPGSSSPAVAIAEPPEGSLARDNKLVPSSAPQSPAFLPPVVEKPSRPAPVLPLALLGAGVVAGGVGTYFGLSSQSQLDEAYATAGREDALATLEQARGRATTANVLFGTAGLAAAGALVSWLLLPREAPAQSEAK